MIVWMYTYVDMSVMTLPMMTLTLLLLSVIDQKRLALPTSNVKDCHHYFVGASVGDTLSRNHIPAGIYM